MAFVVERTRADSVYACTVDDIGGMLVLAPAEHVSGNQDLPGIQGVILRQPKRKEAILSSVWGRLGYVANVGPISGPAIVIEAVSVPLSLKWSKHLEPAGQDELRRLQAEADESEFDGRRHILRFGLDAVRGVQLYRTVLHELGHWVDWLEKVETPSVGASDEAWQELCDRYCRRPEAEREAFAHRYANELGENLRARGVIPFERVASRTRMDSDGLDHSDFLLE
jgi:hypothetical protein